MSLNTITKSNNALKEIELTSEQQEFVNCALLGHNVLVDACIGSGKTTSIQILCNCFPKTKAILYLTYNKLLKVDAKQKIINDNVTVTNYHGFAYSYVKGSSVSDLVERFNIEKPKIRHYDILIIDEYQDIEQELAKMLQYIKSTNPKMQIVAVGDMHQKIYDKTTLDVGKFIFNFLEKHERLQYTICFRLQKELAAMLGRIWQKKIVGVNENCIVEEMSQKEAVSFLSNCRVADILCLGARKGAMADTLNKLEKKFPQKFNKKSVYASIADVDSGGRAASPKQNCAIFTTFDSCKGLERDICVVFDFEEDYWQVRATKPQQSYEILRNIFCVAAGRGKKQIIFVKTKKARLSEKTLSKPFKKSLGFSTFLISEMLDFKFREDIEKCYSYLDIKPISTSDESTIKIKNTDDLIDLSPCIGIYQEAVFFDGFNIDKPVQLLLSSLAEIKHSHYNFIAEKWKGYLDRTLDEKILFLTALETKQDRYKEQVLFPFVGEKERQLLIDRLLTTFTKSETVQVGCSIKFSNYKSTVPLKILGFADVVKNNIVYELKFVSELSKQHFLQLALYMLGLNLEKGILWNTRDNKKYEVRVKNQKKLLDSIVTTITKGYLKKCVLV